MIHILDLNFLEETEVIAAFLVETDNGPILFETGPESSLVHLKAAINEKGYRFEDIMHVFLTHIHLDHAGAAWAFAEHGAKIYVHPLGAKHLNAPEKLMNSATRIYGDDMDRLWGKMQGIPENQLITLNHGEKLKVGKTKIRAWHTPGHAIHHIAWQVNNVNLIAGDVAGVKINGKSVVPPCPPPDIDLKSWEESIQLILSKRFLSMYLTHYGKIEGTRQIKAHLVELRSRLLSWANWMKPYFDQGMSAEEITPKFEAYVENQLRAGGVDDATMSKYQKANPVWMSVAGLLRYWKKQTRENQ